MRLTLFRAIAIVAVTTAGGGSPAWGQRALPRVAVVGETNLRPAFLRQFTDAARAARFDFEVARRSDASITIVIAQESGLGGSNAAAIALDRDGDLVASVVRGGRFSAEGAIEACAKELVKRLSGVVVDGRSRALESRTPLPSTSALPADPAEEASEVYPPGDGVTLPGVISEVKPRYTVEARRAGVEGAVLLQAVVEVDGSVSRVKVLRSLDTEFGLDEEAIKAVSAWRFRPGTRGGQPVPVQISVEVSFTLEDGPRR